MAQEALKVPNYLEASNKDELRRLMLAIQVKFNMKIVFYDFQKDGNKWVCWYELPLKIEREINGSK